MKCNIEVISFYATKKLHVNNVLCSLISPANMCILVKEDGKFRELTFTIPKKYRFARTVLHYGYVPEKVDEYNVLLDYISINKKMVKDKWDLTNRRYEKLLYGLRYALDTEYSQFGRADKALSKIKKFVWDFLHNLH